MTMPMVEGGRPILSVRLFGFPVTVDISFVVITAIIGWVPGRTTVTSFVVWLVMVPLAVLVHELGHAFVARTTGAAPVITLAGLGGLTSYVPPAPVSRARSIAISVAGPAVGIVVGLGLLAYARGVGVGDGLAQDVVATAIWTTLGWSVLNLLPILPLDGGQTLRELLPGSPAKRAVRAAMVSIVVAVLAAALALKAGLVFGALLAAFFVFSNYTTIRSARDQEKVDVNQRLVQLLWAGRSDDAHDLLADQPADAAVHPLVRAAVRAAGDDSFGARRELESAVGRNPADPTAASLLALSHRTREDWAAVRDLVTAGAAVDPGTVLAAQTVAFRSGSTRESAEIGQAWLDHLPSGAVQDRDLPGLIAYNTACGWAGAGERDRGLAAFRRAAELGLADLTMVDSDDDIAPLRPLPGYDEARQQIRRRALAAAGPGESPAH
jgi:Zn-dependent protease